MPFYAQSIDSPHELRTRTPDGRDLVFLTGTAVFDFVGTGPNWLRDQVWIPTGPRWQRLDNVAPAAALAAIFNVSTAVNAGWAADNCNWLNVNGQIVLTVSVAISDIDGHLYRVAFQATAIGVLA
jgi:hypothetical protein